MRLLPVLAFALFFMQPALGQDAPAKAGKAAPRADKPMKSGMMKDGMMQSDVKKAADKKDEEMKKMMEEERRQRGSAGQVR